MDVNAESESKRARTYDLTRGASPTVARLLMKFLGGAEGRTLVDIAGGTGNYAQVMQARGFRPMVLDAEFGMAARSVSKIGPGRQVVGDAATLPFDEATFDCAMMVAVLHHLPDPLRALGEARRVIREGPFVLQAWTQQNREALFVFDYFPGSEPREDAYAPAETIERWLREAGFSRIERETYVYLDTADGSLFALHTNAPHLAGPAYLRNTGFYLGLPEAVRREGLARLARDLRSGELDRKVKASFERAVAVGHGTVWGAWP